MQCEISDNCQFGSECQHKDVAEFCAYHRIKVGEPMTKFNPYDPQIDDEIYYLESPS